MNASLQTQAIALGGRVKYLSAEEATRATQMLQATINRPWELWRRMVHSPMNTAQ